MGARRRYREHIIDAVDVFLARRARDDARVPPARRRDRGRRRLILRGGEASNLRRRDAARGRRDPGHGPARALRAHRRCSRRAPIRRDAHSRAEGSQRRAALGEEGEEGSVHEGRRRRLDIPPHQTSNARERRTGLVTVQTVRVHVRRGQRLAAAPAGQARKHVPGVQGGNRGQPHGFGRDVHCTTRTRREPSNDG